MDVDVNMQWMDSDYTVRAGLILSGLRIPKSVNHPVESQHLG